MKHRILVATMILIVAVSAMASRRSRLYGVGYNFEVTMDTLHAQAEDPLVNIDSVGTMLRRGQTIVVARFQFVPTDSTVWVQVGTLLPADSITATEHAELLWVREQDMLDNTVPDKIVTKIIHGIGLRSYAWYVITLGALVFMLMARYLQRNPEKDGEVKTSIQVMLLDRLPSPYPWMLIITVAATTISIILTGNEEWTRFCFSPTLNPLVAQSTGVCISLSLLWFTLIVVIATISEVFRLLPLQRALAYAASMPCVCSFVIWLLTRI